MKFLSLMVNITLLFRRIFMQITKDIIINNFKEAEQISFKGDRVDTLNNKAVGRSYFIYQSIEQIIDDVQQYQYFRDELKFKLEYHSELLFKHNDKYYVLV